MVSATSRVRLFQAVLLCMLFCISWPGSEPRAHAAPNGLTLYVNNTSDVPDWNPGDGICETAFNDGLCTLRAAVSPVESEIMCSSTGVTGASVLRGDTRA